jgi:hypothetical protein
MLSRAALLLCAVAVSAATAATLPGNGGDGYSYGSADIGSWLPDAANLPSFAVALANVSRVAANITADLHVVGNDRHIVFVAADGMMTMRQDEGGPKLLSDFNASVSQYGGGIGWLFDADAAPAAPPLCDTNVSYPPLPGRLASLLFGVGYAAKTCTSTAAGVAISQVVWAPFGDIPAVVSTVTVTNEGGSASPRLRYLEQWAAGAPVQLVNGGVRPSGWLAAFETVGGASPSPAAAVAGPIGILSRRTNPAGVPSQPSSDDPAPRPAFFVSLDAAVPGSGGSMAPSFSVDGDALFPLGGDGTRTPNIGAVTNSTAMPGAGWTHGVLALASPVFGPLAPGASFEMSFVFGYLPDDETSVNDVVAAVLALGKGNGSGSALWRASSSSWAASLPLVIDVPDVGAWVARETAWHGYMLRALITYDSFRRRHNINQNGEYQNLYLRTVGRAQPPKIGGFDGASRDSLTHVLPFVWAPPPQSAIVIETLKFWLQTQLDNGMLAWATAGYGLDWRGWVGQGSTPWAGHVCSDLALWPLMTAAEYLLATRDTSFLTDVIVRNVSSAQPQAVFDLLLASFSALVEDGGVVGFGAHGLLRILACDHNDGFSSAIGISYFTPKYDVVNATGESVMASATAAFVLSRFADALEAAGAPFNASAARVAAAAAGLQAAVAAATGTSSFVPRAWLGANASLGWFGADSGVPDAGGQTDCMWMEPQAWAVLAGALDANSTAAVLSRVQTRLCDTSPIGCQNIDCCYHPGSCTYAGVNHFSNWPLIWAMGSPRVAAVDAALTAWVKNSMATHAATYSSTWYGVLSASDEYVGSLYVPTGRVPGAVGYSGSYPHFNSWSHAEPLSSAANALGLWFTSAGVTLVGGLLNASEFSLNSSLVSFRRAGPSPISGNLPLFAGHYNPVAEGTWTVELFLPPSLLAAYSHVQVNGVCVPTVPAAGGLALAWTGRGGGATSGPLVWELGVC